jgi:hypothetical protein
MKLLYVASLTMSLHVAQIQRGNSNLILWELVSRGDGKSESRKDYFSMPFGFNHLEKELLC